MLLALLSGCGAARLRVLDARTDAPIAGAEVSCVQYSIAGRKRLGGTDASGELRLPWLAPGIELLSVSKTGYETWSNSLAGAEEDAMSKQDAIVVRLDPRAEKSEVSDPVSRTAAASAPASTPAATGIVRPELATVPGKLPEHAECASLEKLDNATFYKLYAGAPRLDDPWETSQLGLYRPLAARGCGLFRTIELPAGAQVWQTDPAHGTLIIRAPSDQFGALALEEFDDVVLPSGDLRTIVPHLVAVFPCEADRRRVAVIRRVAVVPGPEDGEYEHAQFQLEAYDLAAASPETGQLLATASHLSTFNSVARDEILDTGQPFDERTGLPRAWERMFHWDRTCKAFAYPGRLAGAGGPDGHRTAEERSASQTH